MQTFAHAVLFGTVTALFLSIFIVQQNARQYSTYSTYVPTCFNAVAPSSVGRSNFHLKYSVAIWCMNVLSKNLSCIQFYVNILLCKLKFLL